LKTEVISNEERAVEAEDLIKEAIATGNPTNFIKGYQLYEQVILYFEGVGKVKDARRLLSRLEKILQIVIDKGDPEAQYFEKLGPFFILYSYHFKAKIYESLNYELSEAVKARVGALDFAIGVEWIEQVLNIMVDLLIEGYVDFCLRYLKFTKNKKDDLIAEIVDQIVEYNTGDKFHKKKNFDPNKIASDVYNNFLHLLGLMVERYNEGTQFLSDGLGVLRTLKSYADVDFDYLDSRLMALEAHIRGFTMDSVDNVDDSHVKSRIVPHTIMDSPDLKHLEELMKKYVKKNGLDLPVSVGSIPVLGANPAGSPHLSILGQTGVGKTTLTKQIVKENRRVQDATVFVFDHHSEYLDIADRIIQIGGEKRPESTAFFPVEEIDSIYGQAQEFIRNQQVVFSQEGASPEDLAQKMKNIEEDTRPGVIKFVVDTIESLLDNEEETILPVNSGETVVFWMVSEEPYVSTTMVSTIIKHLLHMAIQNKIKKKTIVVTEEAQRLANDQWIKNLTSEGRKFGLYLVAISQVPEFDPWVVSNSELITFKLKRKFKPESELEHLFTDGIQKFIPKLEVGEYLSYHKDKRNWVFSFNPESLSAIHAQATLKNKIRMLKQITS
jgi:hypothetical protein